MRKEFDNIRPYTDDEIPEAMSRIANSAALPLLSSYVLPDENSGKGKVQLLRVPVYRRVVSLQKDVS